MNPSPTASLTGSADGPAAVDGEAAADGPAEGGGGVAVAAPELQAAKSRPSTSTATTGRRRDGTVTSRLG